MLYEQLSEGSSRLDQQTVLKTLAYQKLAKINSMHPLIESFWLQVKTKKVLFIDYNLTKLLKVFVE